MLSSGTRLGAYEIIAPLGAGGMGEVYRARDTQLDRDVAVKILPVALADDRNLLARFDREARTLAALNHPHIAQIYGLQDAPADLKGRRALVMEFVPGVTLVERLALGPLPVDECLTIAGQIANALQAAHETGVVHRDLKPANIKIRDDGVVKVLDFGLARFTPSNAGFTDEPETVGGESPARGAPTVPSSTVTAAGAILGTPAYMSPEQARGKVADKRTDIWAFGCVLYEMLTRRRPFSGDSVAATMAAILERDPDWQLLPKRTPANVRRLLQRCLEKDVEKRLRDIGDARLEIDEARSGRLEAATATVPARARRRIAYVIGAIVLVALGVALGVAVRSFWPAAAGPATYQFEVFLPESVTVADAELSPNGRLIAVVGESAGTRRIWVRAFDSSTARLLPDTEGALNAFWSPDSQSLGFFVDGKLKTITLEGELSRVVCDITDPPVVNTGTWNAQNTILFSSWVQGPLMQVSAFGGQAMPITEPGDTRGFPHFLPDGRHYLYLDRDARVASVGTLGSKEQRPLPGIGSQVKYSPTGHLLFLLESALMAQPFDVNRVELRGEPFRIIDAFVRPEFIGGPFSVSMTGTLAFTDQQSRSQLVWFDRAGKQLGPAGPAEEYGGVKLSPDGRFAAFVKGGLRSDIWVLHLDNGSISRFTSDAAGNRDPVWSPDGRTIAFLSVRGASTNIYQRPFGVVGDTTLLLETKAPQLMLNLSDWSSDGHYLAYTKRSPGNTFTGDDIWVFPLADAGRPLQVTSTPFHEAGPRFSRDRRRIAYQSDETGRPEVFIQSLTAPSARRQISARGGTTPVRWSPDGLELFYLSGDLALTTVSVDSSSGSVEASAATTLFQLSRPGAYNVADDGRFLVAVAAPKPVTVVVNWRPDVSVRRLP